jgi:hypothetical protein
VLASCDLRVLGCLMAMSPRSVSNWRHFLGRSRLSTLLPRTLKICVTAAEPTCERDGLEGGRPASSPASDGCLIADVATGDGNRRMVEAALERRGGLDILILNAGAGAVY